VAGSGTVCQKQSGGGLLCAIVPAVRCRTGFRTDNSSRKRAGIPPLTHQLQNQGQSRSIKVNRVIFYVLFAPFCGNSSQVPFHQQLTNNLWILPIKLNRA
jgi:hypothetical protein